MIEHTFNLIELLGGRKLLRVHIHDLDKRILENFFAGDIQYYYPNRELRAIALAINGEEEKTFVVGNMCRLEITKEFTKVFDNLSRKEEPEWCEVKTVSLRNLIILWTAKVIELKYEGMI